MTKNETRINNAAAAVGAEWGWAQPLDARPSMGNDVVIHMNGRGYVVQAQAFVDAVEQVLREVSEMRGTR